jgi:hypothetical protein
VYSRCLRDATTVADRVRDVVERTHRRLLTVDGGAVASPRYQEVADFERLPPAADPLEAAPPAVALVNASPRRTRHRVAEAAHGRIDAATRDELLFAVFEAVLNAHLYGQRKRGRRTKKSSTSAGGRATARGAVVDRPRSALSALMTQLGSPLERGAPAGPGRLTSGLIGAQLHQVLVAEKTGLWFDRWFSELVSATESRVREQADGGAWEAPFRLLHGLAAIGTPDAAQTALAAANRLRKLIGRVPGQDPGPRWPLDVRRLQADGDVVRLRDIWGTRYAVIAGFSYGGRDRSVFLFDVDTDFYDIVVSAGDFDDTEQAAASWRHRVGDAGADLRVEPVDDVDQLDCLVHLDMDEAALPAIPDRSVTDNWFAAQRRLSELRTALRRAGTGPIVAASLYRVDTDPVVDEFAQWYRARHGAKPDREAAEALADEGMSGVIPETRFSVSPGRLHHQCELINDWADDELIRTVIALLPDWVNWLAERGGYAEPMRTQLAEALTAEIDRRK